MAAGFFSGVLVLLRRRRRSSSATGSGFRVLRAERGMEGGEIIGLSKWTDAQDSNGRAWIRTGDLQPLEAKPRAKGSHQGNGD